MSVSESGGAGNWDPCPGGHPGAPGVALFFLEAARDLVTDEHSLDERAGCADERCQRAAAAVARARSQKSTFGQRRSES